MSEIKEIVFSAKDLDELDKLIDDIGLEVEPIWDLDNQALAETGITIKSVSSAEWESQIDIPLEEQEPIKKAV